MHISLSQVATALDAQLDGNADFEISGAAEPAQCGPDQLALAMSPKYAEGLAKGQARAAILYDGASRAEFGLETALFVARPRLAMAHLSKLFDPGPQIAPGIHPSAVVDPTATIGEDARIGPLVVIAANVKIGARARIAAHVSIDDGATIGDDIVFHSGARVGTGVTIGDRVILHYNSVVGGDGFAFVTPKPSSVEVVRATMGAETELEHQSWTRIHTLGTVVLGDDVELGSCACIDRGTIRATVVGRGTKIDSQVQIGHNTTIGEDCLLCGQAGIAGSVQIGDRVVLAGKVGVNDNIFIGDDVVAGGGSNIVSNVPSGRVIFGYPAIKMTTHMETYKAMRRLPRLLKDVAALKKAVSNIGQKD